MHGCYDAPLLVQDISYTFKTITFFEIMICAKLVQHNYNFSGIIQSKLKVVIYNI